MCVHHNNLVERVTMYSSVKKSGLSMSFLIPAELSTHPRRATLVSPITGKLTVYDQVRVLQTAQAGSTVDTVAMTNEVNSQWYYNSIDGYCSNVRHYVSDVADFVEVEAYLPAEDLSQAQFGTTRSLFVISLAFQIIIAVIVAAVAIIGVLAAYASFFPAYPKNFYAKNPTTGNVEAMTREQAVSANQINYPGMYVDPTTAAVFDPNAPYSTEFTDFIDWYKKTIPSDWNKPTDYGIGTIVTYVVYGIVAVASIYVIVKFVVPAFSKKKDKQEET